MKFEFLDHPSDLLIKATGETPEEIFLSFALALAFYFAGKKITKTEERSYKVIVKGDNFLNLLVKFLNELLFLTETEGKIFAKVEFVKLNKNYLEAKVYGTKEDIREQVKSATYQSSFRKTKKGFEAKVLLDI